MKKYSLALLCLSAATAVSAQTTITETGAEGYFARGIRMYDEKNYTGCIDQLKEARSMAVPASLREDADYYIALAKFRRGDKDCTEALRAFIERYPASVHRHDVQFSLGDYYFYEGNYAEARRAYNRIPDGAFAANRGEDLIYRRAFSDLKLKDYVSAKSGFDKLRGSRQYADASVFYNGYILYAQGDYDAAATEFKSVSRQSPLSAEARYYLCQIDFKNANYAEVISEGNRLMERTLPQDMQAELWRIVGESEYHQGNNDRAIELLTKYEESAPANPERSALYILGVAHFRNGAYSDAVQRLGRVTETDDALAQSAYLYIGQSYLRQDDMNAAAMAFEKAYKMDYDREVQETAFYNYALAQSQGGRTPFSNSVKLFEDFLNKFPESKYAGKVEDFLIDSYLASNDYDNALIGISSIKSPSRKMLNAKQNILYRLGMREMNDGNTEDAKSYFTRAAEISTYDNSVAAEVQLWLGELNYREGNYSKAASCYRHYLDASASNADNYQLANYGLGYALFQQRDYQGAKSPFMTVYSSKSAAADMRSDAANRIGDCLYYGRDYGNAESYYNRAAEISDAHADYALYQKGFMRGLQRRHSEKISIMDDLLDRYPQSPYAPKAIYEKAQAYIAVSDNGSAEKSFRRLMERYPQSPEARQGQLQLAVLLNSTGKHSEALEQYKSLVRKYPSSEEASVAIDDLKNIYAADGDLQGLSSFLNSVGSDYKLTDTEVERLSFTAAENDYVDNGKTARLAKFIKSYPSGKYTGQAAYYLAEAAYKKGNKTEALVYTDKALAAAPDASFAETALAMQGELRLAKGDENGARESYEKLKAKAATKERRLIADLGLMRIARHGGRYEAVIESANSLLAGGGLTADEQAEVRYSRANAYNKLGNSAKATADYKELTGNLQSRYGAEAAVELADSYYRNGEYKAAEKLLNRLIDSGTSQQYWLARGFILLSDVYAKRGDSFQAREYLESLKENYPGKEADIFEMIETRLKKLKK